MPAPTITCPECGQSHALFWLIRKNGKKQISYRCDRVPRQKADPMSPGGKGEMRYATMDMPHPNPEDLSNSVVAQIPEVWTKQYGKRVADKKQFQLPMMYAKK